MRSMRFGELLCLRAALLSTLRDRDFLDTHCLQHGGLELIFGNALIADAWNHRPNDVMDVTTILRNALKNMFPGCRMISNPDTHALWRNFDAVIFSFQSCAHSFLIFSPTVTMLSCGRPFAAHHTSHHKSRPADTRWASRSGPPRPGKRVAHATRGGDLLPDDACPLHHRKQVHGRRLRFHAVVRARKPHCSPQEVACIGTGGRAQLTGDVCISTPHLVCGTAGTRLATSSCGFWTKKSLKKDPAQQGQRTSMPRSFSSLYFMPIYSTRKTGTGSLRDTRALFSICDSRPALPVQPVPYPTRWVSFLSIVRPYLPSPVIRLAFFCIGLGCMAAPRHCSQHELTNPCLSLNDVTRQGCARR